MTTMRTLLLFVVAPTVVGGLLQARQAVAFATRASLRSSSQQRVQLVQGRQMLDNPFLRSDFKKLDDVAVVANNNNKRQGRTTTSSSSSLQALPTPAALGALPLSKKIFLSCLLPSCLGFWKSEYGVSYAYGSAVALTSFWMYQELILPAGASGNWVSWHAGALIFYGVRLCLFLLYRELVSQRMKEMKDRIEERAKAKGGRLKRAPFVLSVAGLYFGLCAPLLISSQMPTNKIPKWTANLLKGLVATTWGGFILAALGDFNKSYVKAIKGEDHLVTGGIYSFVRHPNYTGEIVGWTSNGLIALIAAAASGGAGLSVPKLVGYLLASVLGALGLDFVLVGATKGLEKRQKETYGETEEYKNWIEISWCGFQLPEAAEEIVDPHVTPEIEVVDTTEETGSGI